LAKTYALWEKMFGVLVTGIFSAEVTGSPSSSFRDWWYSVSLIGPFDGP